ncbi:MAG: glycosyltransferase family 4 protein [Lachnospiraceae bacterium]|nr:glycosyltransferase family 4 protein [Lachnospiraceae bacterium]
MNVLYISHEDDKYGAAKSLQTLFLDASQYGVTPTVLSMKKNQYNVLAEKKGIKTLAVRYYRATTNKKDSVFVFHLKRIRYLLMNRIALKSIIKLIDQNKIDIVHVNSAILDIGILLKKKRNIKLVWHIREFMDLDFNQKYFVKNQIQLMNEYTDMFIFISNTIKQHWINKGINATSCVVYNGIDASLYNCDVKSCFDKQIKIAFVGSITPNKGQYQIIEALRNVPAFLKQKLRVDFLGTGTDEYVASLKKMITDYDLEDVFCFCGFVNDVPKRLTEYDIGVVASKAEGFGRVTVEYMLSGVFVVASNTGANQELVKHGDTGLIFEHNNSEDLYDKLFWSFCNEEKLVEMKNKAYLWALSMFTKEQYVKNVLNVYEEI